MTVPVWRLGDGQVVVDTDPLQAVHLAAGAVAAFGEVTHVDTARLFVDGRIAYGLQRCTARISARPGSRGTVLTVEATGDDLWNAGSRSTVRRLVDGLVNVDNPSYQPDRRGMSRATLAGSLIGFVIVLVLVLVLLGSIR